MASPKYAFTTLLTSDSYLPGVLVLAASLRNVHRKLEPSKQIPFEIVCLVTPETVDVKTISILQKVFDVVAGVEIIEMDTNEKGLNLLGRPDLTSVLTKLHAFRLTDYAKAIFLDADVLPLAPLSHLFHTAHEFAACPDVGWPDIFNSGVFVFTPGQGNYDQLMQLANTRGSWDGGDQGLLNEWRGSNWERLSFTYNTTPTSAYTYAPAFERFGQDVKVVHFIGPNKPWQSIPWRAPIDEPSAESFQSYAYGALIDRWFAVYDRHYRPPVHSTEAYYVDTEAENSWESAAFYPTSNGAVVTAGSSFPGYRYVIEGKYKSMRLEGHGYLIRPGKTPTVTLSHEDLQALDPQLRQDLEAVSQQPPPQVEYQPPRPAGREDLPDHLYRPPPADPVLLYVPNPYPTVTAPEHHHEDHYRPAPFIAWNPAHEPPPHDPPSTHSWNPEHRYENAWDEPRHDSFFHPPAPPAVPAHLIQEYHYETVQPDHKKVEPIFPWESRPRPEPTRVFPDWEPQQPKFSSPQPQAVYTAAPEPHVPTPPRAPSPVPAHVKRIFLPVPELPPSTSGQYTNAWDRDPVIQRYATTISAGRTAFQKTIPTPYPIQTAQLDYFGKQKNKGRAKRSPGAESSDEWTNWAERAEASSRDGDDEGEEEFVEEAQSPKSGVWRIETRRRRKSIGSGYRSIGVQTEGTEDEETITHDATTDFATNAAIAAASNGKRIGAKLTGQGASFEGHYEIPFSYAAKDSLEQIAAIPETTQQSTYLPLLHNVQDSSPLQVSYVRSSVILTTETPREPSPRTSPKAPLSPSRIHPHHPSQQPPYVRGRVSSAETVTSTMESTLILSPLTPPEPLLEGVEIGNEEIDSYTPLATQVSINLQQHSQTTSLSATPTPGSPTVAPVRRKAARVFDPARGVDLFKRKSEDVLTRFLKQPVGWGDAQQGPSTPSALQ